MLGCLAAEIASFNDRIIVQVPLLVRGPAKGIRRTRS
jgi:hypothetical protein